jgi:hypothetical protein
MLTLFEVHLAEGSQFENILSEETRKETMATFMAPSEAFALGLASAKSLIGNTRVCFIAVARKDSGLIRSRLEASRDVDRLQDFEIEG